jgi:hypothetical protein
MGQGDGRSLPSKEPGSERSAGELATPRQNIVENQSSEKTNKKKNGEEDQRYKTLPLDQMPLTSLTLPPGTKQNTPIKRSSRHPPPAGEVGSGTLPTSPGGRSENSPKRRMLGRGRGRRGRTKKKNEEEEVRKRKGIK